MLATTMLMLVVVGAARVRHLVDVFRHTAFVVYHHVFSLEMRFVLVWHHGALFLHSCEAGPKRAKFFYDRLGLLDTYLFVAVHLAVPSPAHIAPVPSTHPRVSLIVVIADIFVVIVEGSLGGRDTAHVLRLQSTVVAV